MFPPQKWRIHPFAAQYRRELHRRHSGCAIFSALLTTIGMQLVSTYILMKPNLPTLVMGCRYQQFC